MAVVMTPTEFNQARAKALRTAREGQPVVVMEARGKPEDALVIHRLDQPPPSGVDLALLTGALRPPRRRGAGPLPVADVDPDLARAVIDEFEQERDADAF